MSITWFRGLFKPHRYAKICYCKHETTLLRLVHGGIETSVISTFYWHQGPTFGTPIFRYDSYSNQRSQEAKIFSERQRAFRVLVLDQIECFQLECSYEAPNHHRPHDRPKCVFAHMMCNVHSAVRRFLRPRCNLQTATCTPVLPITVSTDELLSEDSRSSLLQCSSTLCYEVAKIAMWSARPCLQCMYVCWPCSAYPYKIEVLHERYGST
jgi:hypothetical protein